MQHGRATSHGLTLIELTVVIAVLVLLVGISLAGFSSLDSVRQRGESNRLAAMMRHAYSKSITEGLYVRMRIDIPNDSYWIEGTANPILLPESRDDLDQESQDNDQARDERAKQAKQGFVKLSDVIKMETGVAIDAVRIGGFEDEFDSGKVDIYFFPNGFAEPAMIYTVNGEEEYITLTLNPMTGVVKSEYERLDPPRFFGEADDTQEEGR